MIIAMWRGKAEWSMINIVLACILVLSANDRNYTVLTNAMTIKIQTRQWMKGQPRRYFPFPEINRIHIDDHFNKYIL